MSRLLAALVFVASISSAGLALAGNNDSNWSNWSKPKQTAVPELSGSGAAAGLVLIGGAAAIALGRRRSRKS